MGISVHTAETEMAKTPYYVLACYMYTTSARPHVARRNACAALAPPQRRLSSRAARDRTTSR